MTLNKKDIDMRLQLDKEFSDNDTLELIRYSITKDHCFGEMTNTVGLLSLIIADFEDGIRSSRRALKNYYDKNVVANYLKIRLNGTYQDAYSFNKNTVTAVKSQYNIDSIASAEMDSKYQKEANTLLDVLSWILSLSFENGDNDNKIQEFLDPTSNLSKDFEVKYKPVHDIFKSFNSQIDRLTWQQSYNVEREKSRQKFFATLKPNYWKSPKRFNETWNKKQNAISFEPESKEKVINAVLSCDELNGKRPVAIFVGGSRLYRAEYTNNDIDLYVFIFERLEDIYFTKGLYTRQATVQVGNLKADIHIMDMRSMFNQVVKENPTLLEIFLEKPIWKSNKLDSSFFDYITDPKNQEVLRNADPVRYIRAVKGMNKGIIQELSNKKARGVKDIDKITHFVTYWRSIRKNSIIPHIALLGSSHHQDYYKLEAYKGTSKYSSYLEQLCQSGKKQLEKIDQIIVQSSTKIAVAKESKNCQQLLKKHFMKSIKHQAIIDSID